MIPYSTDITVRYNIVRRDNRCSVCLKKNHRSRECRLNYTCIKCNKKHNIALCNNQSNDVNKSDNGGVINTNFSETFSGVNVVHLETFAKQQQKRANGNQNLSSACISSVDAETTRNILLNTDDTKINGYD